MPDEDFTLDFIFRHESFSFQLEVLWLFNFFLNTNIPKSTFYIKANNITLFEINSGIIDFFLNTKDFLPPVPSTESLLMKTSSSSSKASHSKITNYGATIVGGYRTVYDEVTNIHTSVDTDNDTWPDHYDAFPTNASEWIDLDEDGWGNNFDIDDDGDGLNDSNPLELDKDGDGLLDIYEYVDENNPGYHTSPYLRDSDFDGLDDKWEVDNMSVLGCDPSHPDVFVDLYRIAGCEYNSNETESSWIILSSALIIIGAIVSTIGVFLPTHAPPRTSEIMIKQIMVYAGFAVIIIGLFFDFYLNPKEPFGPLISFYKQNDINLHVSNRAQIHGFSGYDFKSSTQTWLETHHHPRDFTVFSLLVHTVSLSGDKVGVGFCGPLSGICIAGDPTFLNDYQQLAFGHELFHSLHIYEHEGDITYGIKGYEPDSCNYMSGFYYVEPIWCSHYYLEEWQWNSLWLTNKSSVERERY